MEWPHNAKGTPLDGIEKKNTNGDLTNDGNGAAVQSGHLGLDQNSDLSTRSQDTALEELPLGIYSGGKLRAEHDDHFFGHLQDFSNGAKRDSSGNPNLLAENVSSRASVISESLSTKTFASARSLLSKMSHVSGRSYNSTLSCIGWKKRNNTMELKEIDEYAQILRSMNLWPADPLSEENWSGRGQHAKFAPDERKVLDEILEVQETLGSTSSAIVQSVKCRRVLLARKSIQCRRCIKKAWVLEEVAHLTRLNHSHIVRVVGTYTIRKEVSILLYPVAEYNLQSFLEIINTAETEETSREKMVQSCLQFFTCLSSAVEHIHDNITKHMDIKPSNILVRRLRQADAPRLGEYKVYIADFGIAKAYQNTTAAETDGPTSFTRKYASPEVTNQEMRGFAADIFSLGCVFLEMFVTIADSCVKAPRKKPQVTVARVFLPNAENSAVHLLLELLQSNNKSDTSYQANLNAIHRFMGKFYFVTAGNESLMPRLSILIPMMLRKRPEYRPTAQYITTYLNGVCCHGGEREPLAVPVDTSADETFDDETSDGETLNDGTSEKEN